MSGAKFALHANTHLPWGSDPIPGLLGALPACRAWTTIPANSFAPNALLYPDLSGGEFKTNDPDGHFQARTYPYDGSYFVWNTFASNLYIKVTGPGLFWVHGWWSFEGFGGGLSPGPVSQSFGASLALWPTLTTLPESDALSDNQIVFFSPMKSYDGAPELEPAAQTAVKNYAPTGMTTSFGTKWYIETEYVFGLRTSSAYSYFTLGLSHNIKDNGGSVITPDFDTYAGLSVLRLGTFDGAVALSLPTPSDEAIDGGSP